MMVLKQAKFPGAKKEPDLGKRSPSIALAKPIRPLLQSIESPELLEQERSKVAFINQLFKPLDSMQREFSSYYLNSTTKSNRSYLLTSHENPSPIKPPILSTYNSLVRDFQWDPYIESTKIVAYQETAVPVCEENSEFQGGAECKEYDSKHEISTKISSPVVSKPRAFFKDNIMKFNDQGTMTRKLNNASCGSRTPVSVPYTSEASVSTTHVAIQDSPENIPLYSYPIPLAYEPPHEQRVKEYPPPILKKPTNYPFQSNYDRYVKMGSVLTDMNAEKDVDPSGYPVSEYESRPSTKKHCYKGSSGKVLYNEGIDDSVKENYHLPMRIPTPANVKYDKSKVAIGRYINETETDIPYSHRTESKYHSACMESVPRRRRHDDRRGLTSNNQRMPTNNQNGKNQNKTSSGPKPVLSSEQDIDTYIELNVPKLVVPKRKK